MKQQNFDGKKVLNLNFLNKLENYSKIKADQKKVLFIIYINILGIY